MLRSSIRAFTTTSRNMGVTKTTITAGDGPSPQKGDKVTMAYTGWLRTPGQPEEKGKVFDSTNKPGRGLFQTAIGVGKVIKGEETTAAAAAATTACWRRALTPVQQVGMRA